MDHLECAGQALYHLVTAPVLKFKKKKKVIEFLPLKKVTWILFIHLHSSDSYF